MKPIKSLVPLAKWLLRLAVAAFLIVTFINIFLDFQVQLFNFWIAAFFLLFSVLLVIGGFLYNPALTIVSGFFILVIAIIEMIMIFDGSIYSIYNYFLPAAAGFYFLARGNSG